MAIDKAGEAQPSVLEQVLRREWFYEFELPDGQTTTCYLPPDVMAIHRTRLDMLLRALDERLGMDWRDRDCLDLACHEGWFASQLARRGMRVLGVDARAEHVANARLIAEACGVRGTTFEQRDVAMTEPGALGDFDVVLMLGLLYHLENPVQALRLARSHTTNVCVVETQIAPNLSGQIEWGASSFVKTMIGNFAVVDESGDLEAGSPEANVTEISLVPSLEALLWIMRRTGFSSVAVLQPPGDGYEQHRFGKRVMVAGYVEPPRHARGASRRARNRPHELRGTRVGSVLSERDLATAEAFTDLWWTRGDAGETWHTITWQGVPIEKHPFDLMIIQELIDETRPHLIVEAGTGPGGSALFYASLLDLIGVGSVLTTDIAELSDRPVHPRIAYRSLSSTDGAFVGEAAALASQVERTMVILDSDHRADHVRAELTLLSPLVSVGCYLVCEDGIVNGHPVLPHFGPGPLEAIEDFLRTHDTFEIDTTRERLLSTFNPRGYMRRVR